MVTLDATAVLLIEDDEDDALLTTHMLSDAGPERYALTWARGWDEGLQQLLGGAYDVALVDFRLGERNGVELLTEAAARGSKVPVILLTGELEVEVDLAAMNAGAADFLNKSTVNPRELDRSIRYVMQQRKMEVQRVKLVAEQAAREKAEAASQAKDQFLAVLSHELRTPLTPVLIAADVLRREPGLSAAMRADLEMIHRNVQLEARLIDDLLDITRITRGKLELHLTTLDLHKQIRHAIEIVEPDIRAKGLIVRIHLGAVNPYMAGEAARMQQVLWNLLKNAVKFTPAGGTISVGASNPTDRTLRVTVTDSGVGIDAAAIPRIFDAFEQGGPEVTRQFGGLGLGLAITQALVDRHGGSITVSSTGLGQGATFTLTLPGVAPAQAVGKSAPAQSVSESVPAQTVDKFAPEAARSATDQRRILLVEDHADTSRVMCRLLRGMGYQVTAAGSVATALQAAGSDRFDLLISDLGLPDGSGIDVLRQMRDIQVTPSLALSGYGMDEDVANTRRAGFSAHLVKPVDLQQLELVVARLLAGGE